MTRSVEEWIGKHDDAAIPPRVRDRVFEREGDRCHCCGRVRTDGERGWIIEHIIALANGGQHRESNFTITCPWCKPIKDAADMAIKKKGTRQRYGRRGLKRPKNSGLRAKGPKWSAAQGRYIEREN